ncbi:MAG: DEAD/DEAH box helicase family protein [Bacteroidales bacterium]|nr:DEAD/DEAH box helicase family protein [Bacteroidales bacterium]
MRITDYHAKYFTYELTRQHASDDADKLTSVLLDAQVDLNPHQIDAALFAFQSPLSKGAILADEVGLGKTIEAGLVISQKWAERKRKILILVPSSLRKQWSQELQEKFFIPSIILESKNFNQAIKTGVGNPFNTKNKIVICSYQFAKSKELFVRRVDWNLVVIDEAHRLRNVYRTDNKIGKILRDALRDKPKILMTATPLQNTLLELFGLVSFVDEQTFGDIKSFKSQFSRPSDNGNFIDLKDRLAPICKRTLRKQVREYVPYTNRTAITIDFIPSDAEHDLYRFVTNYLQKDLLFALPASQRHLMTLILRKLLASSTYAIAGTLESLIKKLKLIAEDARTKNDISEEITSDYELYDEFNDEWDTEIIEDDSDTLSDEDIKGIEEEINELENYRDLAISIKHNEKGLKLIPALEKGFEKAKELGANEKAIIFTESRRTQNYLYDLLQGTEYRDKIVMFNGSNNDDKSKQIYKHWLSIYDGTDKISGSKTADMRAALVEYFKTDAMIMIATEAAAEGVNLQFCNLVINYDLPWNPQRIEQRIGRCHRYGQKFDVVVVNFLNKKNAADVRVFQLLDEKFKLFSGVFGASDEVLGTIESGVDFEKRIGEIYQNCRTEFEIQSSFDQLQKELEEQINNRITTTRQKLLEHFDEEVSEKLRIRMNESQESLKKYEKYLWEISKHFLHINAEFQDDIYSFKLTSNPFPDSKIPLGKYKIGKNIEDAHILRIGHPLVEQILNTIKQTPLQHAFIQFNLTNSIPKISILHELVKKKGFLSVICVTVESFEITEHIFFSGKTTDGQVLTQDQCRRIFSLDANTVQECAFKQPNFLTAIEEHERNLLFDQIKEKNNQYFLKEADKLTKWADDQILAAENEIKETKQRIKELNRESKIVTNPEEQLNIQKQLQEFNKKQRSQRQKIFEIEDAIQEQRESMIKEIELRMKQKVKEVKLFTIEWEIV